MGCLTSLLNFIDEKIDCGATTLATTPAEELACLDAATVTPPTEDVVNEVLAFECGKGGSAAVEAVPIDNIGGVLDAVKSADFGLTPAIPIDSKFAVGFGLDRNVRVMPAT